MKKIFATLALVVAGFIISLTYPVIAQTTRPAPAPATRPVPAPANRPSPGIPATPGSTTPGVTPGSATPSTNAQINPIDQAFATELSQAANGNIMLGQLALQRSNSSEVKQFAQAEIDEQTQNRNSLARITPNLGVSLPATALSPKFQAAMQQLSQLSGDRFDEAYLAEGGVNAHLENAALFQREAAFGQNRDLIGIANQGLPIIARHFDTASRLTNYQFAQVPRRFNSASTSSSPNNSIGETTPRNNAGSGTGLNGTRSNGTNGVQ